MFAGKLLTPASFHKLVTPFKGDYGCGLYVKQENGQLRIEHDGNNIGFNTHLAYYPEDKLTVIILGNLNTGVTKIMAASLAAVVDGRGSVSFGAQGSSPTASHSLAVRRGIQFLKLQPGGSTRKESADRSVCRWDEVPCLPRVRNTILHPEVRGIWLSEFSTSDNGNSQFVTQYQNGKELKGQKKIAL